MRIIFVRHGHPDYKNDCLTELGHPQAEAAAKRLENEKIDKIFSSSCGRAVETAQHIASRHGLQVEQLDFIRELDWGSPNSDDFVHPWDVSDKWVASGKDIMNPDWENDPDYAGHRIVPNIHKMEAAFDEWLKGFGFCREENYYRVTRENSDTILLASHGGSSSVVIAHLFNLSFPFVCRVIGCDYTGITIVTLNGEEGSLAAPKLKTVNDSRHINGITAENIFGR
ncbi:MAG: histidine phosphatase family protein [Clostridia bacterium]|nr:histidine phosphatase family protein [Clostridia bacterium]